MIERMRTRSWTLPLRWKLVLAAVAVLTAVLTVFGSILYANLSSALLDTIASGLNSSAHTVLGQELHGASGHGPGPPSTFPAPFRTALPAGPENGQALILPPAGRDDVQLLRRLAADLTSPDVAARIVDPSGQIVADSPADVHFPIPASPTVDPALYRAVAATGQPRHVRVQTPDGAVLVELVPLVRTTGAGMQPAGVLQLTTSLRVATTVLAQLRVLLIAGTLLAIGATVVLVALLVRAVLGPLRRMTATSRAIAGGDLSRRVSVPGGGDELTDLARAFNDMVARLEGLLVAQRRFIADASHELRTPLTALAGGMEMLQLPDADPAARARLIRLLQGETARMGRLVDGLLTLTRLDARGKDALAIRPVDLSALAAQVVDETRLLAPDLEVALDLPEHSPVIVPGDVDRLHQVLLNLCTNARAHTHPPGRITVAVRREGATAQVSVSDTGSGIAPEDLPHIWDRLYRTDPSRQRQAGQGGLGLGLAIVRAIVESHGGKADIASTPGVGTKVTVTLPGATVATRESVSQDLSTPRVPLTR